MKEHQGHVTTTHITEDGRESHILPTRHLDIKVPGLNYKTNQIEWKQVTEMSRHPVNGKMVKITTKTGKTVISTLSHSFVTQNIHGNPQTIRGDQLVKGMMVPIKK
jgi:intein/homing endonuclease